jgi:hypothetical protein
MQTQECKKVWCGGCKSDVTIYTNQRGEGVYSDHTANDQACLCQYSGMVAVPTDDTNINDIIP